MIRTEKGKLIMQGSPALLEVELISAVKGFYNALCSEYGEEFAKSRIDFILEKALESDELEGNQEDEETVSLSDILGELLGIIKGIGGEK